MGFRLGLGSFPKVTRPAAVYSISKVREFGNEQGAGKGKRAEEWSTSRATRPHRGLSPFLIRHFLHFHPSDKQAWTQTRWSRNFCKSILLSYHHPASLPLAERWPHRPMGPDQQLKPLVPDVLMHFFFPPVKKGVGEGERVGGAQNSNRVISQIRRCLLDEFCLRCSCK